MISFATTSFVGSDSGFVDFQSLIEAADYEIARLEEEQRARDARYGDQRRFRMRRKASSFGGMMTDFRRFGGRPGGDVGNRKRRNETRFEDWMDHKFRLGQEARAVRQQIEDGIAEYFDLDDGSGKRRKKSRRTQRRSETRRRPGHTRPADVVTQARTGHEVTVTMKRRKFSLPPVHTAASATRTDRPARARLSNAEIRAKLGLPPKQMEAAA